MSLEKPHLLPLGRTRNSWGFSGWDEIHAPFESRFCAEVNAGPILVEYLSKSLCGVTEQLFFLLVRAVCFSLIFSADIFVRAVL